MSKQYDDYIAEHIRNVKKAFGWLVEHHILDGADVTFTTILSDQLTSHDKSKYSYKEYKAYDDYFYGEKTEKVKEAFDYAWLHHIHNNPHHWQYWTLIENGEIKPLKMPQSYAIEMVCDWWTFSFRTGNLKEIFSWYEDHRGTMFLHSETKAFVEKLLDRIKKELDKG